MNAIRRFSAAQSDFAMPRPAAGDAGEGARAQAIALLDRELFALWNLGENVLLAWTDTAGGLLVLSVRHHAVPESIHGGAVSAAFKAE